MTVKGEFEKSIIFMTNNLGFILKIVCENVKVKWVENVWCSGAFIFSAKV